MKNKLLYGLVLLFVVSISSCNDDDNVQTAPELSEVEVGDITPNSVTLTAEITNDGNADISEAGFVYSSVVLEPTLANDKLEVTVTGESLQKSLDGLVSATTYYVRAYATNKKGTGYGEVKSFLTGNEAPVVSNVTITGTIEANKEVTASYTYTDTENDPQGGTTFKWYVADNATGTNAQAIAGATASTYLISDEYEDKFIAVEITPGASSGTSPGVVVRSGYLGVGEATTITFEYDDEMVTYGIINSPTTGRKWLDRNLGATDAATAYNDFANYGDLFQWGRPDDGHQLTIRGASDAETSGVNGVTAELSASNTPTTSSFISNTSSSDWLLTPNVNLWQGVNGVNNPCPNGWRIPTREEWTAEAISSAADGYSKLKLTVGGIRWYYDGAYQGTPFRGSYWTSAVNTEIMNPSSYVFEMRVSFTRENSIDRASGSSCRCIKD